MTTQFYWHIHHDALCEVLTEPIENRIAYIKMYKPISERALRLKLMKPVRGKLPMAYVKATRAYIEAEKTYDWALGTYARSNAVDAYNREWRIYIKARAASKDEIEALHKQECPDCPWNGETIFPKKGG